MDEIYYEKFLSEIYDSSPYFGQARTREPEKFNKFYFKHLTDRSSPILEFGHGTGMLTIPMARAGFKLDSVDISPYMHKILAEKLQQESSEISTNVNQIVADALTYNGPELYNSIVMPEGILIAIPNRDLQFSLLESCYRNLKKGGRILTDFFQPRYKIIHHKKVEEHTRFRTPSGEDYLLSVCFYNDEHSQIQEWDCVFTKQSGLKPFQKTKVNVKFRYLFYSEIELMLRQIGFNVIDIDCSYADGRGFSVIAEKL